MWQQFIINGLVAGSALGLLAASFAVIYQTAGFFHFAHASVFTLAAYIAYSGMKLLGLPCPLVIVAAVSITAVVGWLQYSLLYGPISRRNANRTSLLLVSLGLMVAMENSVSMVFGDEFKTLSDLPVGKGISIGSALITPIQVVTILSSAVALAGLGILLNYTRLGVSLRAVADDRDLAAAVGLEPVRLTGYSFAIGSALAAIAAILSALDTGLTPSMGFNALLLAVVAVVIGGIGSIQGALVGGLAIGMVRNLTAAIIPIAWIDALVFLFLILFLVLRPHGIMGDAPSRR